MKALSLLRRWPSLTAGHCLFTTVLLVRLVVLMRLTKSPFLLPVHGDMHFYNDWAQRILSGEQSSHFAFYGLPLYAYILAFLYRLFGYNPFIPGLLQALLESGTTLLIYRITLRILPDSDGSKTDFSSRTLTRSFDTRQRQFIAIVAALGWAFFVPAQAYSVILMPTAWLTFAFWVVVWRLVANNDAPAKTESLLLGLVIGVTAMAGATILFLTPLILAAVFCKRGLSHTFSRLRWLSATLLFCGILIGTSPCWIHNYFIARDPVFLSAHSGINFWIGNNPDANGYPRFPPGLRAGQAAMLEDSIASAELAAGHRLKRAEVSAFWSAKAKNYIGQHFGEWLKLLLKKLRNFWSAFQYDDLSIITSLREQGIILPGLYFGIIAALALPGMLLVWRMATLSRWITLAILLQMTALLTVFVTERYRLPVVPGLLIFATLGLSMFWKSVVAAQYGQIARYLVLLLLSTIFVSWPQRNPSLWALDAYNSGWQALEAGNFAQAEKKLLLARAYVPTNPETNFALGNLRLAQNNLPQAKADYIKTLTFDQRHKGAFNNLGVIAMRETDWNMAENYLRGALGIDPRDAKTHFLLAQTLVEKGERNKAKVEIEQALRLLPGQREFIELKNRLENSGP